MTVIMLTCAFAIAAFVAGFALARLKAKDGQFDRDIDLKQTRAENERLSKTLEQQQSERVQLVDELQSTRIILERSKVELTSRESQATQLEQRLSDALNEATELHKSEKSTRESLVKIEESTDNLMQKESEKTVRLNTLQEKFDQLQLHEKQAREASVKAIENAENSKSIQEEKTTQLQDLKIKFEELQKAEKSVIESSATARESVEKLQKKIEGDSQIYQERLAEKSEQLEKLQTKFDQLLKDEKQASEAAATARETIEKLKEQKAKERQISQERFNEKTDRIQEVQVELNQQTEQKNKAESQLSESRQSVKKAEAQLEEVSKQSSNYEQWWKDTKKDLAELQKEHSQLTTTYTRLNTTLEQREKSFKEQFQQLEHNKDVLSKEFERLANKVLEEKGHNFKELNRESITNLLNPIQSEMKGFKDKVEKIHERDAEQRIQLKTELENLQKLNRDITDKADKLATALQGQKKIQGNWGELMLENVLDGSGLRLGTDYKREVSFTTEDGRQRPDAIVYLPQKKHMVIDAKTSLAAYTRYVNSDDELERGQMLKEHAQAVSDRINELADRNYYRLPGLNSPEIVVMFIPIESAYVEALKYDETLYQRAIERNVLVATPTTLLTSLNIVRQLWRFEDQNKNTAELADRAEKFYRKLKSFLTSMQDVGKQLDRARGSYDKALGQLHAGKGNLIKQASEFKELGVAVNGELPAELVERANLELEQLPEHTH